MIASITWESGSASASLISEDMIVMFSGRPFSRFLPLISMEVSSSMGYAEPMPILIFSAVLSPMSRLYFFLMYAAMDESNSSPATLTERDVTMPPSDITATSDVPPPMSTIMEPVGSATGRPAPIAAAIGSSMMFTRFAFAFSAASLTARLSTAVTPDGMQMITLAFVPGKEPFSALWMNSWSIVVVTSKSAITPSFRGRTATIEPGVLPITSLAS